MRKTFAEVLVKLAKKDKSIYLLVGDQGFSVFEEFIRQFPDRYIDCGVAEQNMMGVAAGLAMEGKKPYVYSIIPFVTMRPYEQVRDDIAYQNLNVKIIGMGAGLHYGSQDFTHHGIEDISILRVLPNISVICPADSEETMELTLQSYKKQGPAYMRFTKANVAVHKQGDKIILGKPSVIKNGKDGVIIATGSCVETAMNVAKKLEDEGRVIKVISMHTIKPIDEKALVREIQGQKNVFTLEEHSIIGGLGSAVAEILLKNNARLSVFKSLGLPADYKSKIGSKNYLKKCYGIDEDGLYKTIIESVKLK